MPAWRRTILADSSTLSLSVSTRTPIPTRSRTRRPRPGACCGLLELVWRGSAQIVAGLGPAAPELFASGPVAPIRWVLRAA